MDENFFMSTPYTRLDNALANKRITWTKLAERLGIEKANLSNWKKKGIPIKHIRACADMVGVSNNWLELGEGEMYPAKDNATLSPPAALIENKPSNQPVTVTSIAECATDCVAHVHVPLLTNSCSMGYGMPALSEDVFSGQLLLVPNWVHTTLRPSSDGALRFIHAYGDSMSPTFNSGDVLLVDTGVNDVRIDGIYAMRALDRLFIKRVRQRMDGTFEISSDNKNHKTTDTLNSGNDVTVIGRVLWVWNGCKV